jgi:SnoaL-like protein
MSPWELEVRESVRQTLADYTAAGDGSNLAALAACFARDGVLEFGGGTPLVGPDAIASGLGAQLSAPGDASRLTPAYVRHHVSSVRFGGVSPERVHVSSYFAVYTDIGVDHWGLYRDILTPAAGRWLFASRKIRVDGFSEASLMKVAADTPAG